MDRTDNAKNPYAESRARIVATFAVHQIIAMLGVMVATPFVLALIAPALRVFGFSLSVTQAERILTEMHYFPL